jgi:alpha-tubulin suppressor-like RCC1 family protein
MPVILDTSNIIIDYGTSNFIIETAKSTLNIEKDIVGNTSNLLAEPIVETVSRMYPPVRTFDGTNIYPVSIASGAVHTVFLTNEGKVYGCGRNDYGQLGLNDTSDRSVPTLITTNIGSLTISAIACGAHHTVFLTNDGKVYSCGFNESGQLGLNDTVNKSVPTLITTNIGSLTISAIAGGGLTHTLFITNNGKVYSCGSNSSSQLGLNDTANRNVPTLITNNIGSLTISAIACGYFHSLFITNDGKVYSCGRNIEGQLGLNDTTQRNVPTLITTNIGSLTISAIAGGDYHTVILTNNGKVYSCGWNGYGSLGLNDTSDRSVPTLITTNIGSLTISAISCGHSSAFLTNDGKVYSCGLNDTGQLGSGLRKTLVLTPQPIIALNSLTFSAISCGELHTVFLTNDGKVYSCGNNNQGRLGLGNTLTGPSVPTIVPTFSKPRINGSIVNLTLSSQYIVSIAAGYGHTLFVTNEGKVYGNGYNEDGRLGINDGIGGRRVPTLITNIIGPLNITRVACGENFSLFLTNDGKVYSCGSNGSGQLGVNDTSVRYNPTLISTNIGSLTITDISCSSYYSLFLTNTGKVYGCGYNVHGHLGVNDTADRNVPTLITTNIGSLTISAIACGVNHSLFLTNNGKVYGCGLTNSGQLGLNDLETRNVPTLITTNIGSLTISAIACGADHSLFLTNDGKVYSCGYNIEGRLGLSDTTTRNVPTLISTNIGSLTISAIACTANASFFLTNAGKVYSCGNNSEGQLGLNDTANRNVPTLISTNIGSLTISAILKGWNHVLFLTNEGKVYTCGWNLYDQLGLDDIVNRSVPTIIPTFNIVSSFYGSGLYTVSYSTFTTSFEPFRCFNDTSSVNNPATWRAGDYNAGVFNSNLNLVSDYNGDWLVIKLPVSIKLKRFDIKQISTALNRAPKNFRLYGSTNGSLWTLLVDKENATYTSQLYVHTDMTTQYPSNTNQYYNHFGLVVNTLVGNAETTLSFDEFFIYGVEQVSTTQLLLNSTNKSLNIPNSILLPSYPNSNLNYNLTFPVPTFVNNISTSSNIILQGDYTINQVSRTSSQLIPNGGQINILNSSTLTLQESSNITINYHLLNPIVDPKGAQWTYSSANPSVYHLGNVGIGTKTASYPLHVNGNMFVSSTAYTGSGQTTWTTVSDRRIKENIVKASYEKCLENVKNIELYRFNFKNNVVNTNDYNQLGFIAQEVQSVYPKAVEVNMIKDKTGEIPDLLSLNTTQIDYTLYGAVKELIKKVEILEKKLEENENSNIIISDVSDVPNEPSSNIMEPPIYPGDYFMMTLPLHLRVEHMMLNESSSNIAPQPISREEYLRNLMMLPPDLHTVYEEYLRKLMMYPEDPEVTAVPNESTSNIIVVSNETL